MGCFNITGFYSHLPIKFGDDVVSFICISRNDRLFDTRLLMDINDYLTPISLPIYGKYDDYGNMDNIIVDDNVKIIEQLTKNSIDDVLNIIDNNSQGRFLTKDDKNKLNEIITGFKINTEKYSISLIIERLDIFQIMTEEKPVYENLDWRIAHVGEFWLEKLGFVCLTEKDSKIWMHPESTDYHIVSSKWNLYVIPNHDCNIHKSITISRILSLFIKEWKDLTNIDLQLDDYLKEAKYTELCYDYTKSIYEPKTNKNPLMYEFNMTDALEWDDDLNIIGESLDVPEYLNIIKKYNDLSTIFSCYGVIYSMRYSNILHIYNQINVFDYDLKQNVCDFIRFCKSLKWVCGQFLPNSYGGQNCEWDLIKKIANIANNLHNDEDDE